MLSLFMMVASANALQPLPLRVSDLAQASARSGASTALPLDDSLAGGSMTLVTVLDELRVAQPYTDDFVVTLDGGDLRISLADDADVPAGLWTLVLEPKDAHEPSGCPGCPASTTPSLEGSNDETAAREGVPAEPNGPFEFQVRVPSARLVPVEPEVELTLVAPLTFDLLPGRVTDAIRPLLCPDGSYPQCVDSQVFLGFREVGGARRSCGWQATLEVERWGQGVSAEYPPHVDDWHRTVIKSDNDVGWQRLPLDGLCIRPGESGRFSFVPPDNIPLGRTDLRLLLASGAAEDVPAVAIKLNVRRSLSILVAVTLAGALLKLLHQLVIPAFRASYARRRYLDEAWTLVRSTTQDLSRMAQGGAGQNGPADLERRLLEFKLKRGLIGQAFWARSEQAELVKKVDAALKGLMPALAGRSAMETAPSLPEAPDATLQPLGPLLLETFLGLVVLVFFVYATYAPIFTGTLPELTAIFTFAYAANLGLESLMRGLSERFGARSGAEAPKESPTGRS